MIRFSGRSNSARPFLGKQSGLTLIELMISMALGLFVVAATTALLVSTKSGYLAQDDDAQIQDTGRYAIEIIARSVRQTAYANWDSSEASAPATTEISASIAGLDAHSLKSRTAGIEAPLAKSVNGSDVLAIRFFGSGSGDNGDGTMLNCAGFGVAASSTDEDADASRGWSIFYVAEDANGEPELYCKYLGNDNWASQAIARGVESFQVLYGLDADEDGLPNQYLNATAINALDDGLSLRGHNARERAADRSRRSHWKKVVAIKAALLVRGANTTRSERPANKYDLFGKDYANAYATADAGVRISESALPKKLRGRERRIFSTTIQLPGASVRNPA